MPLYFLQPNGLKLTSAVGIVSSLRSLAASGMAWREVGEAVGAADGLNVVHVALAAEVAGGRQVDLERGVAQVAATEQHQQVI